MNKKREKIINLILVFVFILSIGVILFLTKSKVFNKNGGSAPKEEEIKINEGFEKVEVKDLENRLNALNFAYKKQDYYNKTTSATINTIIADGKVSVTMKCCSIKRAYSVMNVENAISVLTNVNVLDGGTHVTYILTEDGKVFKIIDKIKEVKEDENYIGTAKDLGLTHITSMATDKNLKFKLGNELGSDINVYMKSDDGRYFTDEKFNNNEEVVELIEIPMDSENTSE